MKEISIEFRVIFISEFYFILFYFNNGFP
jgi:hypothetical protein